MTDDLMADALADVDPQALTDGLGSPAHDPEAPYGRRADGTPYQKSPEERQRLSDQLAAGRERAKREGRTRPKVRQPSRAPARPRRAAAAAPKVSPHKQAALGILQLAAAPLAMAGRWVPVLQLDALALTLHAEPLADALAAVAEEDSRWAAVMEKAGNIGPKGALILAGLPVVLQLAANHRLMPPNPDMGILDRDQLYLANGIEPPPPDGGEHDQPAGGAQG